MFFKKKKIEEIIETEEKEFLRLTIMFKNGQIITNSFIFTDKTLEVMNSLLDWFYRWKSASHYLHFNDAENKSVNTMVYNRTEICYILLERLTRTVEKERIC